MKNILVLGAGRTSAPLIDYLLERSAKEDWFVKVGDFSLTLAKEKVKNHTRGKAIQFDILNENQRKKEIGIADLVISILPATLHIKAAKQCLTSKTNFINASYVSKEMYELDNQAKDAGLIFLNEMGVDPGLDHMESKRLINKTKKDGGKITSFRSFGGGLVAPRSDDNCWGYKFTWSPMNVVNAGKAGGRYLKNGEEITVPYKKLFLDTELIDVKPLGKFESYPNRDAVAYLKKYGIEEVKNIYRGSLRKPGFCKSWNALIKIGLTNDEQQIENSNELTFKDWMGKFIPGSGNSEPKERLINFLNGYSDEKVISDLLWLDLFNEEKIPVSNATSAQILLKQLEKKWHFKDTDSDMTVLQTEIKYEIDSSEKLVTSTLILDGKDIDHTAMARAVGIPLGIGAKLILQNKISEKGVLIPTHKDIYEPVLEELKEFGIEFKEEELTL